MPGTAAGSSTALMELRNFLKQVEREGADADSESLIDEPIALIRSGELRLGPQARMSKSATRSHGGGEQHEEKGNKTKKREEKEPHLQVVRLLRLAQI